MSYPFGRDSTDFDIPQFRQTRRRSYTTAIREMMARTAERRKAARKPVRSFSVEAMEPRILLSADPIFAHTLADSGDYTLDLNYDADADLYHIRLIDDGTGLTLASSEVDTLTNVDITGSAGEDRLTVDFMFRPDPAFALSFDGGDGEDELILKGPTFDTVTYDLGADGSGTITQTHDATDHIRTFSNVELVTDITAASNRAINDAVAGRGGDVLLTDGGAADDGISRVQMGPAGSLTTLDFLKSHGGGPYDSGTVSFDLGDGDDLVRIEGLDAKLLDAATDLDGAGNPDVLVTIKGGSGNDTLFGPQKDVTWRFTAADRGVVDGAFFDGFEVLQGADGNDDTFYFEIVSAINDPSELLDGPGSFGGTIHGGALGQDVIVQQGSIFTGATTSASGTANINFQTFSFTGMEPTITVGGTIGGDDLTLQASSLFPGRFELIDGGGALYGGFAFSSGAPLVINLGFGDDTFRLGDGLEDWAGGLTVRGDFGADVILMNENLSTDGGDVIMDAEVIAIGNGAVINTRYTSISTAVSHGDIILTGGGSSVSGSRFAGVFEGQNPFSDPDEVLEGAGIAIGGGAMLLAAEPQGGAGTIPGGKVSISVDAGFALDALAFTPGLNEKIAASLVQIGNATIQGGTVDITSSADSSKAV